MNKDSFIEIKGAKMHNLKNVSVKIPRNKIVVFSGLSGSGKSSLAFDTLFAEGQRRYVESLSSYARQFLGRLNKPKVDSIDGISPAISIEQKVITNNPRSTVGTSTEIYDYLKLLFSRVGKTYSPISGNLVKKHNTTDVINYIKTISNGEKLLIISPIKKTKNSSLASKLDYYKNQGFARLFVKDRIIRIEDFDSKHDEDLYLVVDRIIVENNDAFYNRTSESIETAFSEGNGLAIIQNIDNNNKIEFSNRFSLDGMNFIEPNEHLFSFNNPMGACEKCDGYGDIIGIDEALVIPNTDLSIFEGAVAPWKGEKLIKHKNNFIEKSHLFDFPIHRPYHKLNKSQKDVLWNGNDFVKGINHFFNKLQQKLYKIQNRVLLSRYRGRTKCSSCNGKRLCQEASYVKIDGLIISDLVDMPISKLEKIISSINLSEHDRNISSRLMLEIQERLKFLNMVGLGYLTLNRKSNTLSGGESQRINLATSLGSSLVGSLYILDEPSIGLHPNDTSNLIKVIKNLRDLGNTVIIVEHDEDIIMASDYIIDLGPDAGVNGGEVVAQGNYNQLKNMNTWTGKYLSKTLSFDMNSKKPSFSKKIKLIGARHNNLKNIDVIFPLNSITAVTGVSGSGKSTLIKDVLLPAIKKKKDIYGEKIGEFTSIEGDFESFQSIEFISQKPIGVSSRSNPVTYIKAYDEIRKLFAEQQFAKQNSFQAKHFSFNVDGGRCDNCKGEGIVKIEMQFMADVELECDECAGKRFKKNILQVKFDGLNIFDVLSLSVDKAIDFFIKNEKLKIANILKPLQDVGMGYVALGQSSSTLSGGEAQRIKLASFLNKGYSKNKTLFLFDEPTTGLHMHDVKKLIESFNALVHMGHSLIVIEHNTNLIKQANHIIDLGPSGGNNGGYVIATGSPKDINENKKSSLFKLLG